MVSAGQVGPPGFPTSRPCHASMCEGHPCHQEPSGAFDAIQVFTDGSFDGSKCSWAFCTFGYQGDVSCFLGWAAGQVPDHSNHPLCVSPARASAICGEQHALFWAAVWCMQSPAHAVLELFSDCIVALNQVTGSFGWSEGDHGSNLQGSHASFACWPANGQESG